MKQLRAKTNEFKLRNKGKKIENMLVGVLSQVCWFLPRKNVLFLSFESCNKA
jgi:hypothetical protein